MPLLWFWIKNNTQKQKYKPKFNRQWPSSCVQTFSLFYFYNLTGIRLLSSVNVYGKVQSIF